MAEASFWTGELSLDRLAPLTKAQEQAGTAWRMRGRRARELRAAADPEWQEVEQFLLEEQIREAVANFEAKKAAA